METMVQILIALYIRRDKLNYPIYVDTLGIFSLGNPHLLQDPRFHTFLLDENNNVILVGNPLQDRKSVV